MIDRFMLHPLPNTLAVIVLIALLISWITSLILALRDKPLSLGKNGYTGLTLLFSLLCLPAMWDVLQTKGVAFIFAAITTLLVVVNIVVLVILVAGRSTPALVKDWVKWGVLILTIAGIAVSGYFVTLKFTGAEVACGPSEGCGSVQNSPYAILFGVIPMGVAGLAGYLVILAGWVVWQFGPASLKKAGALAMWGFSVFGAMFSTYLTFLEPFVIGATCMWCIISAVLMIELVLVSTPPAQQALAID
jgi:uncharacterized membrane protein